MTSLHIESLIFQGFLTFQEDQLENNHCFARILYATTILIIQLEVVLGLFFSNT
jgi:hypothetical protein